MAFVYNSLPSRICCFGYPPSPSLLLYSWLTAALSRDACQRICHSIDLIWVQRFHDCSQLCTQPNKSNIFFEVKGPWTIDHWFDRRRAWKENLSDLKLYERIQFQATVSVLKKKCHCAVDHCWTQTEIKSGYRLGIDLKLITTVQMTWSSCNLYCLGNHFGGSILLPLRAGCPSLRPNSEVVLGTNATAQCFFQLIT